MQLEIRRDSFISSPVQHPAATFSHERFQPSTFWLMTFHDVLIFTSEISVPLLRKGLPTTPAIFAISPPRALCPFQCGWFLRRIWPNKAGAEGRRRRSRKPHSPEAQQLLPFVISEQWGSTMAVSWLGGEKLLFALNLKVGVCGWSSVKLLVCATGWFELDGSMDCGLELGYHFLRMN